MKLHWQRINLRLRHEFVTATARRTDKQTLWVRLAHDGIEGWGEAVPTDTYGQTLESAEAALAEMGPLLGDDPRSIEFIVDRLLARFDHQRAAVAAVDAALHDWLGKSLGQPIVAWLGLDPAQAPRTSITLGIDSPELLRVKMAELASYPIWKVKVGGSTEEQTLAQVRRDAPDKIIRVDANTAWPADEALQRLARVAAFRVEFVEQPCRRDDLDTLRHLRESGLCQIVADESCVRPQDVPRLAGCADGINIKLSKCGGIVEARRMIAAARRCGLKVMLGCMIESSLGIAAAAQLAPMADWIDLDGHLLLAEDPFVGLGGEGGCLTIGRSAGFGVKPQSGP